MRLMTQVSHEQRTSFMILHNTQPTIRMILCHACASQAAWCLTSCLRKRLPGSGQGALAHDHVLAGLPAD